MADEQDFGFTFLEGLEIVPLSDDILALMTGDAAGFSEGKVGCSQSCCSTSAPEFPSEP
jgi:hypothetical protein